MAVRLDKTAVFVKCNLLGMQTFVVWAANTIQNKIQQAIVADQPDALRVLYKQITDADDIWRSWAWANDGSVVLAAGGYGVLSIPPQHVNEAEKIRLQYSSFLGEPVSLGIGTSVSEASRAHQVAVSTGQPVCFYSTEECDKEDFGPQDDVGVNPYALRKSLGVDLPIASTPAPAPSAAAVDSLAADVEQQFHDLARDQHRRDGESQVQRQQEIADTKKSLAAVLQRIQEQLPVLEQYRAQSPELYASVVELIRSIVGLARTIDGQADPAKVGNVLQKASSIFETLKLPASKQKRIQLPVGTVHEGGPTGDPHMAGRVKVQHGDGKTAWVQVRSGQILASEDRDAIPVVGHSGHPVSSRNPGGA